MQAATPVRRTEMDRSRWWSRPRAASYTCRTSEEEKLYGSIFVYKKIINWEWLRPSYRCDLLRFRDTNS